MTVYHIVLFKLKEGVHQAQLDEWAAKGKAMVGKIPGLIKFDCGPALPVTAHRAQGFSMGLVAILEKPEDVTVYAEHPAHQEVHTIREALCHDTLAFDVEF